MPIHQNTKITITATLQERFMSYKQQPRQNVHSPKKHHKILMPDMNSTHEPCLAIKSQGLKSRHSSE